MGMQYHFKMEVPGLFQKGVWTHSDSDYSTDARLQQQNDTEAGGSDHKNESRCKVAGSFPGPGVYMSGPVKQDTGTIAARVCTAYLCNNLQFSILFLENAA